MLDMLIANRHPPIPTFRAICRLCLLALVAFSSACGKDDADEDSKQSSEDDRDAGASSEETGKQDAGDGENSASENGGDGGAARPEIVRFTDPEPMTTLSGTATVRAEIQLNEQIEEVRLGFDDDTLTVQRIVPKEIRLDTFSLEDGPHTMRLRVVDVAGREHGDDLELVIDNPPHRFLGAEPAESSYGNGEQIELQAHFSEADLSVSADFSALDTGFDPASVNVEDAGNGTYLVSYAISASNSQSPGAHAVKLTATNDQGEAIEGTIPLQLRRGPELPVIVRGATYVPLLEPDTSVTAEGGPTDIRFEGSKTILSGGQTKLRVTWTQDPENPAERLIIGARGYSGYYVVPLEMTEGDEGSTEIVLELPAGKIGFEGGSLDIIGGIEDILGQVGDWITETVAAIVVGGDGIEVSLTWDTDVDLDLEIADPNGNLIDFENQAIDGGTLDLDSNALCEIDGVNAEKISWQPGEEHQGEYMVRINLYDACGESDVNWQLTARFCGLTETFSGSLTAADATPGMFGREITSFVVDCNQRVSGFVRYEKQLQSGGTFPEPVPFAPIRIRTASGDTTLQQAVTDRSGAYDLRFQNLDQDDYYVEVEASVYAEARDADAVFSAVTPLDDGEAYRFKTADIDGGSDIVREEDILITGTEARAFNIREQVRRGLDWVAANLNATVSNKLKPLPVNWTFDEVPPHGTSYHLGGELFILSAGTSAPSGLDRDAFDDPVLMHEFMHYVVDQLSFSPLPGGSHSGPVAPDLAYSEGLATFLGQVVLGDPNYIDTNAGSGIHVNIETVSSPYTGTPDLLGNIDENAVAALLWDLLDTGSSEMHDRIHNEKTATLKTLFEWFPAGMAPDAGGNGNDLVDFLDGFRSKSALPLDPELKCALDQMTFPYLPSSVMCPP